MWTTSRDATGVDQTFAFIADQFGEDVARRVKMESGYKWNKENTLEDVYTELASEVEVDYL